LTQLKTECKARGLKGYSSLKKPGLLELLEPGTIMLSCTKIYTEYQSLLSLMEREKQQRQQIKDNAIAEETARRIEQQEREKAQARKIAQVEHEQKLILRQNEIQKQAALHQHKHPYHNHPLALSNSLVVCTKNRTEVAQCESSRDSLICQRTPYLTCESCDYDICFSCHNFKLLPSDKQLALIIQVTEANDLKEEPRRQLQRIEEEKKRIEAEKQRLVKEKLLSVYPDIVRAPLPQNKDRLKPLDYVVLIENGYYPDGFHSYAPPVLIFDSSYQNLSDANMRVEFLLFYNNLWGLSREEIESDFQWTDSIIDDKRRIVVACKGGEIYNLLVCTRNKYTVDVIGKK
jgi:hypothetical protein